jgi:antirestriction protein ArdC
MKEKVRHVLASIIERFKTRNIPKAIALSMFPIPNIPAHKWSLLNRTLMFIAGTQDARGFGQWKLAGRKVKKGAKAIYILAPYIKKEEDDEKTVLKGFLTVPVFKVEDTEGDPLDYEQIELPVLPLLERAEEWSIAVKAIPGNYRYYGAYLLDKKEIVLASKEEVTFFHELSHVAHEKVKGKLKAGQDPFQEITAELSAAVLCSLIGKSGEKYLGSNYQYIETYAKRVKKSVHSACLTVMSDTEKVLNLILAKEETDGYTRADKTY